MELRSPATWTWDNIRLYFQKNQPRKEVLVAWSYNLLVFSVGFEVKRVEHKHKKAELEIRNLKYAPYFSVDYKSAREKFRDSLKQLLSSKEIEKYLVSYVLPTQPSSEMDCSIDIGYVPGSKSNKHLIIHVSGTHGVEGFAGSAIQVYLLQKVLPNLGYGTPSAENLEEKKEEEKGRPHILFIHAMNPTGMTMNRRFTQDNIDLNRNAIFDDDKWRKVTQMDYVAEAEVNGVRETYKPNREYKNFQWAVQSNDEQSGHYWTDFDQQGLFFGGLGLSPEHTFLRYFLTGEKQPKSTTSTHDKQMRCLKDVCGSKIEEFKKISLIDVHTGLGKHGVDTLLTSTVEDYDKTRKLFKDNQSYLKNGKHILNILCYYCCSNPFATQEKFFFF
ncbi:hypothetical protein RFI_05970 [Reticulomyxa filosa]|uniref:DUF2817 domain-containing protein n=1 Tax=Reticulomyxa filosa TaxID=46433 RepID=X6NZ86_RETFI|nr:hypothetical protein RFI_05970 [Reticulomyxa filosa]|eukprot:ETO31154.1 hypothetical protein RFI_05970 [Reticulomyxa filosa]